MKTLQITEPGKYEIKDIPIPEPGPQQVLVKVLAVTTCPHWDIHVFDGIVMLPGWPLEYPYVVGQPGHEACGEIAAVGSGVENVSVGERVCIWCDQGHHRPGCYAQYVIADAENVIAVPESLAPEACASLELAMCMSGHVMYAERTDAISGHNVGVFGLGPAGLVCVQLVKAAGAAKVVGFDPLAERRNLASELGADETYDPRGAEAASLPTRHQPGSLNCSFDCAGIPPAVHQAMDLTTRMVILFAVQREDYIFKPRHWPMLALVGAQMHSRQGAEYAAERLSSGRLNLQALVTHKMRLEQYTEAVELLKRKEALKVAFFPWQE